MSVGVFWRGVGKKSKNGSGDPSSNHSWIHGTLYNVRVGGGKSQEVITIVPQPAYIFGGDFGGHLRGSGGEGVVRGRGFSATNFCDATMEARGREFEPV